MGDAELWKTFWSRIALFASFSSFVVSLAANATFLNLLHYAVLQLEHIGSASDKIYITTDIQSEIQ